jgi:hypothetical protein
LHVHAHVIVIDGVFTEAANGQLSFHLATPAMQSRAGRVHEEASQALGVCWMSVALKLAGEHRVKKRRRAGQ